jgi:hypothetical protein
MQALEAARLAGFEVPDRVMSQSKNWLAAAMGAREPTTERKVDMSLVIRMTLGQHPAARARDIRLIRRIARNKTARLDLPAAYFGTQLMRDRWGKAWDEWNGTVKEVLVRSQRRDGRDPRVGSWDPQDTGLEAGGRVAATALAVLTLESYYRFAPTE